MFVTLAFVLSGLQYAFSMYDEQIHSNSSQVLMMSSNSIEEQLKRVEEVSFNIATDPEIQRILTDLDEEVKGYDLYQQELKLENILSSYVGSEKNIPAIYIYDSQGREFLGGSSSYPIAEKDRWRFLREASTLGGKNFWIIDDGSNQLLTSVRQIRSYEDLSFDNLGKLFIQVDLEKIVQELPKSNMEMEGNIVISKGEEVFYSEKPSSNYQDLNLSTGSKQGYEIQSIAGKRFFINHIESPFEDWTYWSVIPYNSLFSKITAAKFTILIIFFIMFMILIYLGFRFSKHITNPIEELVVTMQQVQKGNFKIVEKMTPSLIHEDEVGILYTNFKTMVERIDDLIKENYSKQLLLKETEFKALQAQINPHFLYNTLESINWQAKANQQVQISNMVEALGYLFRHSLNFNEDIITLENELEIVRNYLTIQQYRFEERLEFHMEILDEVMLCAIPKFTLQPIIENAIHYALEPSIEVCVIKISATIKEEHLFLRIEDNGPGIDPLVLEKLKLGIVKTRGTGIGLKNIHERIKLGFGEEFGITVENLSGKGAAIIVELPYLAR